MRAPPDALTTMSGTRRSRATLAARAIFSPTTDPMEPPMKEKSMTATRDVDAVERPVPRHDSLVLPLRFGGPDPIGVRLQIRELEGVGRAQLLVRSPRRSRCPGAG